MPVYEYQCKDCGHIFEEWQKNFEDHELKCPICTGLSKRVISHSGFILKGSGWYATDYCRPGGNNGQGNYKAAPPEPVKRGVRILLVVRVFLLVRVFLVFFLKAADRDR